MQNTLADLFLFQPLFRLGSRISQQRGKSRSLLVQIIKKAGQCSPWVRLAELRARPLQLLLQQSEIYDTLFRLGFTLFDAHIRELMKTSAGLRDELRINIEGYMSFALENPDLYQLCFERPVPGFGTKESLRPFRHLTIV
ncbi:MAG: hypothetical protein IPG44_12725 [Anaerolineales bacterium]|nr:hypothetical protein [Anaerolineales bacterium]